MRRADRAVRTRVALLCEVKRVAIHNVSLSGPPSVGVSSTLNVSNVPAGTVTASVPATFNCTILGFCFCKSKFRKVIEYPPARGRQQLTRRRLGAILAWGYTCCGPPYLSVNGRNFYAIQDDCHSDCDESVRICEHESCSKPRATSAGARTTTACGSRPATDRARGHGHDESGHDADDGKNVWSRPA